MRRLHDRTRSISRLSVVTWLLLVALVPGDTVPRTAASGQSSPSAAAAQSQRPKFALLVGINDYQSKEIPKLRGAVNDVAGVKELLITRYGFRDDAEHIRVLTDRSATKENILGLFDNFLIKNAEKHRGQNPIIVFHYSGHGSRAQDFDGDEPDGKDETIVPVDSGLNGKVDITDDEIEELLWRLAELTDTALYVFDSCYSGTVNRGDNQAREAPEDKARYPRTKARAAPARKAARERIGFLPPDDRYVVISGARSNQKAYEKSLPGGKYHGAMTYYLLQELRRTTPETSYMELMTRVAGAVRGENENQSPQVQGEITRAVLGGSASRKDYFIKIFKVENNKQLIIEAGAAHGVRQGSLVAVYKSGTERLSGKEGRVALAEVKSVGSVTAAVEITELSPDALVSVNDQVVLLSPSYGSEPLNVALETDADAARGAAERKALGEVFSLLSDNPLIKVTWVAASDDACREGRAAGASTPPAADVYVRRGTFSCAFPSPPLSKQKTAAGSEIPHPNGDERIFYIAAKGGEPIYDFWVRASHPESARAVSEALLKLARQRNLLTLENRTSSLNRSVEVTVLRVTIRTVAGEREVEAETPIVLNDGGGGIYYRFKIGEYFRFQIRNKSANGADVYVTALNVSNDGAINMMYPSVPGDLEPLKFGNAVKTRVFRATAPLGEENFKIIVTTRPSDFGPLIQGRVAGQRDGDNNPLNVLLRQSLTGRRSQPGVVTRGIDDWGTLSVSFVIQEK